MTVISPGIEFHSLTPIRENEFSCKFSLDGLVKRFFDVEDCVHWRRKQNIIGGGGHCGKCFDEL